MNAAMRVRSVAKPGDTTSDLTVPAIGRPELTAAQVAPPSVERKMPCPASAPQRGSGPPGSRGELDLARVSALPALDGEELQLSPASVDL